MRTKTLLLSAVALAAGLLSSQAQSNTYSANVVGYATVVIAGNAEYTLLANPFDDGNGNQLTNLLPASLLPSGSQCLTWDPILTYTTTKRTASGWNGNPSLPPGVGFFIKNGNAGAPTVTNTFSGTVITPNGSSITNTIAVGYNLEASPIPYQGNVTTNGSTGGDAWMNFGQSVGSGAQILTWDPILTYTTTKRTASAWNGTVTILPGQGFFLYNKNGPASNVVETLNLQ